MAERPRFLIHASVAVTSAGRILMVQEEKPESRGKWNLPGGHVDHGEPLVRAAERELREETNLTLDLRGLIGVYQTPQSLRFVFRAELGSADPSAGHEILAVRFMAPDEILALPDEQLVSQRVLRQIVRDVQANLLYPLDVIGSARRALSPSLDGLPVLHDPPHPNVEDPEANAGGVGLSISSGVGAACGHLVQLAEARGDQFPG